MRIAALADVFKVILYVIASFLLAALISPYFYEIGKGFANIIANKDTTDRVAWLVLEAERADFTGYFKRALLISSLLCLFPLFYFLDLRRHARHRRGNPWTVGLPPNSVPPILGQPLKKVRWGILHTFAGFCLAPGFSLAMAWFLLELNWFQWKKEPTSSNFFQSFGNAIKPALGISIIEEIFFRGALLGIFLRAFRPSIAIITLSLVFATTHFLTPPDNLVIENPRAASAGFEMLSLIGQKFLQVDTIIHSFIALFLVGLILGIARYRTAGLWLPIGLNAGWIFTNRSFTQLTDRRSDIPEHLDLYIGTRLTEGVIPIAVLIMTGFAVALYLRFAQSPLKTSPVE